MTDKLAEDLEELEGEYKQLAAHIEQAQIALHEITGAIKYIRARLEPAQDGPEDAE